MLTVIDGGGESAQEKSIALINGDGFIEISNTKATLQTEQQYYEMALRTLNFSGKKRLYKELQKNLAACLKKSVALLRKKRELLNKGDDRGAIKVCKQYAELCNKKSLLLEQIKKLYEILNTV